MKRSLRHVVCALSLLVLVWPAVAAASNLIHNGDFEAAATKSPPPGWTMWGYAPYKVATNYTRATNAPHRGEACFRIYHPANTEGYIASDPQYAIRPKPATIYRVTFWARTDRPGPAGFGFLAYASVQPYVDAPAPGDYTIDCGNEWREYSFEVREGLDFFADQSRYLLLAFHATRDRKQEKTLWIDDVVVTERHDPTPVRLLDPATLNYAPLPHRLRPGDRLEFTVDASRPGPRAQLEVGGISFHRVCGWTGQPYNRRGDYTLAPELERAMRELRLPMTRFYGVGDEPFALETALDKAVEISGKIGVPLDHVVLEFEDQGAETKLPPEDWARGVRHSVAKGYSFRHWEIANEPYLSVRRPAGAFRSAEDYIEHVQAVSAAIRKIQPTGQIGIGIDTHSIKWGNYVLRQTAGAYDFVAGHYYAVGEIHRRKFEATVLTENYKVLDRALRINALIQAYNPGREVYQYDTEWGMHSGGPNGERADNVNRNANIFGTMHRAVRMIYYAREGLLRGASGWQMLSRLNGPGFGILTQEAPEKRYLLYWLYYYFNRHLGATVLPIAGTAPYYTPAAGDDPHTKAGEFPGPLTPVLATLSADGKQLHLVIANGSWGNAIPCHIELRNFPATQTSGIVLSQSSPDAPALLEHQEDAIGQLPLQLTDNQITCTLPAHSVVFVTLMAD